MAYIFPDEAIEELREIIEAEFGEPVTHDEARVMANSLYELYELMCQTLKRIAGDPQARQELLDQLGQ